MAGRTGIACMRGGENPSRTGTNTGIVLSLGSQQPVSFIRWVTRRIVPPLDGCRSWPDLWRLKRKATFRQGNHSCGLYSTCPSPDHLSSTNLG